MGREACGRLAQYSPTVRRTPADEAGHPTGARALVQVMARRAVPWAAAGGGARCAGCRHAFFDAHVEVWHWPRDGDDAQLPGAQPPCLTQEALDQCMAGADGAMVAHPLGPR